MTDYQTCRSSLATIQRNLQARIGARDQLRRTRDTEQKQYESLQSAAIINSEAQGFMLSEITERRQQAVSLIEDMATAALARIYGPDHALRFISNEGERQEGKATNFTMRLQVVSKYKGQELVTGLIGSVGGGLIEAVAFALRIAFLSVLGWNGPVLLDEAYSAMSADGKLQALAGFLKETCELTGRQIIFVTHAGHGFREVADRIIHVSNEDGEAVVRYVDASHIPSLPASEGW